MKLSFLECGIPVAQVACLSVAVKHFTKKKIKNESEMDKNEIKNVYEIYKNEFEIENYKSEIDKNMNVKLKNLSDISKNEFEN